MPKKTKTSLERALKLYEQGRLPKRIPPEPKPAYSMNWYKWKDIKNSIIQNRLMACTPMRNNETTSAFLKRIKKLYEKQKEKRGGW